MTDREFDIVLHGVTGFVGRLIARHLSSYAGAARIALSGRSETRLLKVRADLGVDWPIIVADSADPEAVARLAHSATVVGSTVGPYAAHGMPLLLACAEAGTAYADLNGELSFARGAADAAHAKAVGSGARIVLSAGFESIPSDLGVLLLHEQAAADGEGTLGETTAVMVSLRASMSGGSAASYRSEVDVVRADPALKQLLADAYSLSPDRAREPYAGPEFETTGPRHDALLDRWVAPFIAGAYNSRIVRRSNALDNHAYGPGFRYQEVMGVGKSALSPALAGVIAAGSAALEGGLSLSPTRALLDRVLPKPGAGPSQKAQQAGHFRLEIHTRTSTGARYVTTFAAQGDPGYTATAIMFGESLLRLGRGDLTSPGGVLTPAAGLGSGLVGPLVSHGFDVSVARVSA